MEAQEEESLHSVASDGAATTGFYVSLSLSQYLSLQVSLDLLSCKCATWAALKQTLGVGGGVSIFLEDLLELSEAILNLTHRLFS